MHASISIADGIKNVSVQHEEDFDQSSPLPIPIPVPAPNDQNDAEKVWDSAMIFDSLSTPMSAVYM